MGKEWIVSGLGLLLGGVEGVFAYYFTQADQEVPDWPVKIALLGEAETVIGLGIQSWFTGAGLSASA